MFPQVHFLQARRGALQESGLLVSPCGGETCRSDALARPAGAAAAARGARAPKPRERVTPASDAGLLQSRCPMSASHPAQRRGSVLIPTLIAMVIIAMFLSAILPLTVTGYGLARADRD